MNAALTRRGAARRARHTRPLHALERISDVDESFTHCTVSTLRYATLRYATLGTCARELLVVSPAQQCSVSVAPSKSIDFPALYDVD